MIDFILIEQIVVFLIVIIGLWLSFGILFSDKKARINRLFFLMTISILLWVVLAHFFNLSTQVSQALFLLRLTFGAISLFFVLVYFFSTYFPKEVKRYPILDKVVLIIGGLFILTSIFTDLIIQDIQFKEWGIDFSYGRGGNIFLGFVIVLTFLIIGQLFRKYFILSKQEKLKFQYFLIGVFIYALMNTIFNVVIPLIRETIEFWQFGTYSAIFFLGFTAYAIIKQQLFEIKVVLTSLFVGLIAVLLAVDTFILTEELFMQIIKGITLVLFLFFGRFLIKSIIREIKQKEKFQNLTLELKKTNIKLKKMDRVKSGFISITSHQLRTPLTIIKGYVSTILDETYGKIPENIQKPLKNVYDSNERLIKLVNDILGISRIEAGKMELKLEKTSLEEVIVNVVEELKSEAKRKNIYLKFEKPSKNLPKILIDRDKIRQAILNIVDNAIKYTDQGGITIKIKEEGSKYKIEIKDTGEGMNKEEISSLFQSFSRGKAGKKSWIEGAGLGLHIAKRLVEMHCGEIWAESLGKNKGSTFYIKLRLFKNPRSCEE